MSKSKSGSGKLPKYKPLSEGLKKAEEDQKVAAKVDVAKKLRLPTLKVVSKTEDRQAEAQQLREWIAQVPAHVNELVKQLWKCVHGDDAHFDVFRNEFTEVFSQLSELLNPGTPAARTAVLDAYGVAMAENVPTQRWAILAAINGKLRNGEAFPGLMGLGIVSQVSEETQPSVTVIRLLGRTYQVSGKSAKKIAALLDAKAMAAKEEAVDHFREEVLKLLDATTPDFSFEKLLAGEEGQLGFSVPDSGRDTRDGGAILIHSDGEKISVLGVVGHFSRRVREIMEANRTLLVRALSWENFTQPSKMGYEIYKDLRCLWGIINRGMQSAADLDERLKNREEFKASCEAERDALVKKATVGAADWHLKKMPGIALISIPTAWEVNYGNQCKKYWYVSFTVERSEDGKVRLVEFPERLKDLFQNPKLTELTEPGETSEKLPYPMSAMLRKTYAIALHKDQIAARNKSATNTAKTEPAETSEAESK